MFSCKLLKIVHSKSLHDLHYSTVAHSLMKQQHSRSLEKKTKKNMCCSDRFSVLCAFQCNMRQSSGYRRLFKLIKKNECRKQCLYGGEKNYSAAFQNKYSSLHIPEQKYIQRHLIVFNDRVLYMYHTQRLLCCVHRVCMLYIPVLYIAAVCTVYSIYSTFAPFQRAASREYTHSST